MAFGTDKRIPPPGVHRRIVVIDTGNGLVTVALATGDFGPNLMQVPGLSGMAADTGAIPVKSKPLMGIGKVFSETDFLGCRRESEQLN